jgi:MarR family transcriptional regulator, organic hydroperoxide resistance regulator
MNASTPSETVPNRVVERRAELERRRRDLHRSLDLLEYTSGPAGEAWGYMARVMFIEGKPRFPSIATELDLSPPQAIVMRLLGEPRKMSELASAMHCDNSNVTGIVDRLEERGLVERRPAEHDRRVKLIAATAAGEALRNELNRRLAEPPDAIARLSLKDQRTLRDILRRALGE